MIEIRENVELSKYSTFRIGGKADFFIEVKNEEELEEAIKRISQKDTPFFILGGGSNVVFADSGFRGTVIRLAFGDAVSITGKNLDSWAGNPLGSVLQASRKSGLSGLEWAAGIPGTFGGAIRGNAGAFGGDMAGSVKKVRAIDVSDIRNISLKEFSGEECRFAYRSSLFKERSELVVVSASLELLEGNQSEIDLKIKENLKKRQESQPEGDFGSSGSFFKNPIISDPEIREAFEKDTGKTLKGESVPAGWLIQDAGLSGKSIGGMKISEKHGNFILNTGGGTFEDLIVLVGIIKQKIRTVFHIELEEEVMIVGEG